MKKIISGILSAVLVLQLFVTVVTANAITVSFTLIGADLIAEGGVSRTWIGETEYEADEGSSVASLIERVFDENGISSVGVDYGYISSVTAPIEFGGHVLGEFTNGMFSGWMYKVNGESPQVGIDSYMLSDGDSVVLYYTNNFLEDVQASEAVNDDKIYDNSNTEDIKAVDEVLKGTVKYLQGTVKEPSCAQVGGEWLIMGLARSGEKAEDGYFEGYLKRLEEYLDKNNGILHETKYTEYARVSLALMSLGVDPEAFCSYDLIKPLSDYEKVIAQGTNGAVYALITLCAHDFGYDEVKEKYVEFILSRQNGDGGFALSENVESDPDVSAMAIQALSVYEERSKVKTAIEKALEYLSRSQTTDGGFISGGTQSCESSAQVLIALLMSGNDIEDEYFVKGGRGVYDSLVSYYSGGGFLHTSGGEVSLMATEQACYALAALKRFNDGKNSLYDMRDVELSERKASQKQEDTTAESSVEFFDISESIFKTEIEEIAKRAVINGRSQGEFAPEAKMTRAEYAAIVVRAMGLSGGSCSFDDVKESDWFFESVGTAYANGIINGVSETEFAPQGTIVREEAALMCARAVALSKDTSLNDAAIRDALSVFDDYTKISSWAREGMAYCAENGILRTDLMEINPREEISRGEVAYMIYNLMRILEKL